MTSPHDAPHTKQTCNTIDARHASTAYRTEDELSMNCIVPAAADVITCQRPRTTANGACVPDSTGKRFRSGAGMAVRRGVACLDGGREAGAADGNADGREGVAGEGHRSALLVQGRALF